MEPKHRLTSTNDPQHWLDRAEEARACAENISVAGGRDMMLRCADDYEILAVRALERLRREKKREKLDKGG